MNALRPSENAQENFPNTHAAKKGECSNYSFSLPNISQISKAEMISENLLVVMDSIRKIMIDITLLIELNWKLYGVEMKVYGLHPLFTISQI